MTTNPRTNATANGGIFRFLPFDDTRWIKELFDQGLQTTQTKVMLSLLISVMVITLLLLVYYAVRWYQHRLQPTTSSYDMPVRVTTKQTKASKYNENTQFDQLQMYSIPGEVDAKPCGYRLISASEIFPTDDPFPQDYPDRPKTPQELICSPSSRIKDELCYIQTDNRDGVSPSLQRTESNNLFDSTKSLVSSPHSQLWAKRHNTENNNGIQSQGVIRSAKNDKRQLCLLIPIVTLVVASVLVHLVSIAMLTHTQHTLVTTLRQAPAKVNQIALQATEFLSFAVDAAYDITNHHIIKDVSRSDGESHLRHAVAGVERAVADALACWILNFNKVNDSVPSNNLHLIPTDGNLTPSTKQLADSLLKSFHTVTHRLAGLHEAANVLTTQFIRDTHRSWYEYRQLLSYMAVEQTYTTRRNYSLVHPMLNSLINVTCTKVAKEPVMQFTSCDDVRRFIQEFITYAAQLPFVLPNGNIEEVVQYALLPKALSVEELVADWIPAVSDLPGKGVPFLLKTFLTPEIDRLKSITKQAAAVTPPKTLIRQYGNYVDVFSSLMIIIIAFLFICELASVVTFTKRTVCQPRTPGTPLNKKPSPSSKVKRLVCNSSTQILLSLLLGILIVLLAMAGILITTMGASAETEICDYLSTRKNQLQADRVLTERLIHALKHLPSLREFMHIPHLNLSIPYPILNTLSSDYRSGGITLLTKLNINPPFNLSAVLNSAWLNWTLTHAWNWDVRQHLEKVDLVGYIPKISLDNLFQQTMHTMKFQQKFDELQVLPLTDYLNDPGNEAYFVILMQLVEQSSDPELDHLAVVFRNLTTAYNKYALNYHLTGTSLDKIKSNKLVLEPLQLLVGNMSIVLDQLNTATNAELIRLIDQVIGEGWPRFLQAAGAPVIQFVNPLLYDMIPYPGLHQLYQNIVGVLCPLLPENLEHIQYMQTVKPIIPQLTSLGVQLFCAVLPLILSILTLLRFPR